MNNGDRHYGTVKTYNSYEGAGTIALADGREAQVRYSAIRGEGVRKLEAGMWVSFQLEQRNRGLYAVCVQTE